MNRKQINVTNARKFLQFYFTPVTQFYKQEFVL